MPITAIVNQKGGVGKTTLTVHLAVALARQGQRVIVIDGDPQGNCTSWLLDGDLSQSGFFDLLVVGKPLSQCMRLAARWKLAIMPSNGQSADAMIVLAALHKPFETVANSLRPLSRMADHVLIDMPPSRAAGFAEMLFAAEWVLVPTQLERLSMEGVGLMAETVGAMQRERGRGPRLLGVVPNMARMVREHRVQLQQLVDAFGQAVWPPIPHSIQVAEASAYGDVLFDLAPSGKAAESMNVIVNRYLAAGKGRQ